MNLVDRSLTYLGDRDKRQGNWEGPPCLSPNSRFNPSRWWITAASLQLPESSYLQGFRSGLQILGEPWGSESLENTSKNWASLCWNQAENEKGGQNSGNFFPSCSSVGYKWQRDEVTLPVQTHFHSALICSHSLHLSQGLQFLSINQADWYTVHKKLVRIGICCLTFSTRLIKRVSK